MPLPDSNMIVLRSAVMLVIAVAFGRAIHAAPSKRG